MAAPADNMHGAAGPALISAATEKSDADKDAGSLFLRTDSGRYRSGCSGEIIRTGSGRSSCGSRTLRWAPLASELTSKNVNSDLSPVAAQISIE